MRRANNSEYLPKTVALRGSSSSTSPLDRKSKRIEPGFSPRRTFDKSENLDGRDAARRSREKSLRGIVGRLSATKERNFRNVAFKGRLNRNRLNGYSDEELDKFVEGG